MDKDSHLIYEQYEQRSQSENTRISPNNSKLFEIRSKYFDTSDKYWADHIGSISMTDLVIEKFILPHYRQALRSGIRVDAEHFDKIMEHYILELEKASKIILDISNSAIQAIPVNELYTNSGNKKKDLSNI